MTDKYVALREWADSHDAAGTIAAAEARLLLAERAAMVENAARYQFLKDRADRWWDFMEGELFHAPAGQWDERIDAARREWRNGRR